MTSHFSDTRNLINNGTISDTFAKHFASHFMTNEEKGKSLSVKLTRLLTCWGGGSSYDPPSPLIHRREKPGSSHQLQDWEHTGYWLPLFVIKYICWKNIKSIILVIEISHHINCLYLLSNFLLVIVVTFYFTKSTLTSTQLLKGSLNAAPSLSPQPDMYVALALVISQTQSVRQPSPLCLVWVLGQMLLMWS